MESDKARGSGDIVHQPLLERGAIELCARKVASSTGDARKALELCRQAIEVVQNEAMKQYTAIQALGMPPCTLETTRKRCLITIVITMSNNAIGLLSGWVFTSTKMINQSSSIEQQEVKYIFGERSTCQSRVTMLLN